jgi:hypothetical protein
MNWTGIMVALPGILLGALPAVAHQPDTSYLNIQVGETAIDASYLSDVITLQRILPRLDADGDGDLSRDEAEDGRAAIEVYFREHVVLEVDGRPAAWGESRPLIWPNPDLSPIRAADWHQLLIEFPFRKPVTDPPERLEVRGNVFAELGVEHRILGEFWAGSENLVRDPLILTGADPVCRFEVAEALAREGKLSQKAALPAAPNLEAVVQSGIAEAVRPVRLLLLLALLIAAGPGARQMLRTVVWFALALIAVTIPIGLAGLALPLRAVEMAIAMTAGIAALGNLRSHPIPPGWLAIGCGVIHGLGLGARVREASLAPLRPVDCLLPFLAGVAGVVILASTITAFVLMAMGAWNKGNIVSRAISLASLMGVLGLVWWGL